MDLACGPDSTIAVDSEGAAWTWGALMDEGLVRHATLPRVLAADGAFLVRGAIGQSHAVVLDHKGSTALKVACGCTPSIHTRTHRERSSACQVYNVYLLSPLPGDAGGCLRRPLRCEEGKNGCGLEGNDPLCVGTAAERGAQELGAEVCWLLAGREFFAILNSDSRCNF